MGGKAEQVANALRMAKSRHHADVARRCASRHYNYNTLYAMQYVTIAEHARTLCLLSLSLRSFRDV